MRFLPFVLVGLFWVAAYAFGGLPAIGVMALFGLGGELLLFGLASRYDRQASRDAEQATARILAMRENDALNRILGRRRA